MATLSLALSRCCLAVTFLMTSLWGTAASAKAPKLSDYDAPDRGYLLLSASSPWDGPSHIQLCVRRLEDGAIGLIEPTIAGIFIYSVRVDFTEQPLSELGSPHLESTGYEVQYKSEKYKGTEIIKAFQPGKYEIYRIFYPTEADCNPSHPQYGSISLKTLPAPDFSIPFEIKAGRATYVGAFKALTVRGKNYYFKIWRDAGYRYVVTDQSARDIESARSMQSGLVDVDLAVPRENVLASPLLATEP